MPRFSNASERNLLTCHPLLQTLFQTVVEEFDCKVLEGHRGEERQNALFKIDKTKVKWPHSKHNQYPSVAIDVAPCPIDWDDRDRFHFFAGYVKGVADQLGIHIRWGGDWDSDTELKDNRFDDLVHFELST